jgi:hypothetical protein
MYWFEMTFYLLLGGAVGFKLAMLRFDYLLRKISQGEK